MGTFRNKKGRRKKKRKKSRKPGHWTFSLGPPSGQDINHAEDRCHFRVHEFNNAPHKSYNKQSNII